MSVDPQVVDKNSSNSSSELRIFRWISLGWLCAGLGLCFFLGKDKADQMDSAQWVFRLWLLSSLNLWVLTRFMKVAFALVSGDSEKKAALSVQAFCWGTFKVICLGLFIGVLLKGYSIPTRSLLLGVATLVVVPLLGGFFWSQRVLRHA